MIKYLSKVILTTTIFLSLALTVSANEISKTQIESPDGYYLVTEKAIHKLSVASFDKSERRYEVNVYVVQGTDSYFKIGERSGHSYWYSDTQQFFVSQFAKVPGLQKCNFWTDRIWSFVYKEEAMQRGVWKEASEYPNNRIPSANCENLRIEHDTCNFRCLKAPEQPKPMNYLVKDLPTAERYFRDLQR